MKKLLIIAFSLLATTVFCAEKTTTAEKTTVTTAQMTETNPVMTTTSTVSLGDSFMAAFGMSGNTTTGGSSEGGSGSSSSGSSSTGSISSALNVSTTIASGSVTIATPYGNTAAK